MSSLTPYFHHGLFEAGRAVAAKSPVDLGRSVADLHSEWLTAVPLVEVIEISTVAVAIYSLMSLVPKVQCHNPGLAEFGIWEALRSQKWQGQKGFICLRGGNRKPAVALRNAYHSRR